VKVLNNKKLSLLLENTKEIFLWIW